MSNVLQRIITGVVLVSIISFAIVYSLYSYILLVGIINILMVVEFYGLQKRYTQFPRRLYGLLLSAFTYTCVILVALFIVSWKFLLLSIPLVFIIFLTELIQVKRHPFIAIALLLFPVAWITIPLILFTLSAFLFTGSYDYEPAVPLGCFILIWLHDSIAYVAGSLVGRKALSPIISPNKTWEGSLAAAIVTIAASNFFYLFTNVMRTADWTMIACCIIVFGTFGDLFKSILKRNLGIKDSGKILPGHGGMLDRFDSLIGSAPFIYSYLVLVYA